MKDQAGQKSRKKALLLFLIAGLLVAGSVWVYSYYSTAPCQRANETFRIIASGQGFNNSKIVVGLNGTWPIMRVHQGDLVCIHVTNVETVEAHGFAVAHYLDGSSGERPITVGTQSTVEVTFTADQPGTFRVYCWIFCTVHAYMQSGRLIVS